MEQVDSIGTEWEFSLVDVAVVVVVARLVMGKDSASSTSHSQVSEELSDTTNMETAMSAALQVEAVVAAEGDLLHTTVVQACRPLVYQPDRIVAAIVETITRLAITNVFADKIKIIGYHDDSQ